MHEPIDITEGISWTGVNDRETDLFEAMWPLSEGISYNSYLIHDEKTALIDTVKKTHISPYLDQIARQLPRGKGIDYLVINHIEPDHSGSIPVLKQLFPEMQIVGNKKTLDFLKHFYGITSGTIQVEDGHGLKLGKRVLTFYITPMVHWPETMMTYEHASRTLFSGDAFGSFKTLDGGLFDDEINTAHYDDELLRYFSNIIGKFSTMVQKAIEKVEGLDIGIIAPTHGPVWRKNPGYVMGKYDLWSRHMSEEGVVVAFASMYGNTLKMAEAVCRGLAHAGVKEVRMHDVARVHPSYIIRDTWRYKGVILGSCTYELGLFPPMRNLVELLEEKSLKNRTLGIFGSYGWSGGAVKNLKSFAERSSWKLVDPVVEVQCSADQTKLDLCRTLGENLGKAIGETG